MERSVLICASVFLVILVVVVEVLIARFARRRESLDREMNVFSPNSRVGTAVRQPHGARQWRGNEIKTFFNERARSSLNRARPLH